jgi:hypothetical protein
LKKDVSEEKKVVALAEEKNLESFCHFHSIGSYLHQQQACLFYNTCESCSAYAHRKVLIGRKALLPSAGNC